MNAPSLFPFDANILYLRIGRTMFQPAGKLIERAFFSLCPYLHLAIPGVSYPACESERTRLPERGVTKAHALDFAPNESMKSFHDSIAPSAEPWRVPRRSSSASTAK